MHFLTIAALVASVGLSQAGYLPNCNGNPIAYGQCPYSYQVADECQSDYDCQHLSYGSTCCKGPCNNLCTLQKCYSFTGYGCSYRLPDACNSVGGCPYGKTCCQGDCQNYCR